MKRYPPEGELIGTPSNRHYTSSLSALEEAMNNGILLEARAIMCDSAHNLIVELGDLKGIIPRTEGALGIEDGSTRDIAIISRVNKPVCFVVTEIIKDGGEITPILSRRNAQQQCLDNYVSSLTSGQIIPVKVTHLEPFGCFVDIGCGIPSLIPIDAISVSRITHPSSRFSAGQDILAVVRSVEDCRISLTHKELLGTWEENAVHFSPGETVSGIVRSVEGYGIFIELAPNLAGLAEPKSGVKPGQHASVYIKSLIPEKMKVKLIIVDSFDADYPAPSPNYRITEGVIERWRYSPPQSQRVIETVFKETPTSQT